jgi:hypothetical protein
VSLTKDSSSADGNVTSSGQIEPAHSFTLLDLYERATISGNSLASELGLYLYTYEETVSSAMSDNSQTREILDSVTVHEKALAAIIEVVISNSNSSFDYVRVPEPAGGVQEWWARMLSGSMNVTPSTVRVQPSKVAAQ